MVARETSEGVAPTVGAQACLDAHRFAFSAVQAFFGRVLVIASCAAKHPWG